MKLKKFLKTIFICLVLLAFAFGASCAWLYFAFNRHIAEPHISDGVNGVWARHMWVGEEHSAEEYETFFGRLERNSISDVYFHVGPWLDANGGIRPERYKNAAELVSQARSLYPDLRIHAWIGQMTVQGGGPLDLADPAIRERIVQSADIFIALGFDGIHYDFEPIYTGNEDYIKLLRATKKHTDEAGRLLSVASGQVELIGGSERIIRAFAPKASVWSRKYFEQVADEVDQVCVMLYDTALPTDWLYGMYAKKQTQILTPLVAGRAKLFIGAPSYEENRPGHRPWAENIETAIKGIQLGIDSLEESQKQNAPGIAIFAEWTTDEKEWKTFRENWLGNNEP